MLAHGKCSDTIGNDICEYMHRMMLGKLSENAFAMPTHCTKAFARPIQTTPGVRVAGDGENCVSRWMSLFFHKIQLLVISRQSTDFRHCLSSAFV